MKLGKAIEILSDTESTYRHQRWDDYIVALKLGIEAMKWIKFHRYEEVDIPQDLLPGETEERDETGMHETHK